MAAAAQAIPEHTSSSFPLGVHCVQEPAGVPLGLCLSSLTPYTLFLGHKVQSTEEGPPPRDGTLLFSVKQANLPLFLLPTFLLF